MELLYISPNEDVLVLGGWLTVFVVITLLLWLYALISILKNDFKNPTDKIVWLLVVLFLPILGAFLYIVIGRSKTIQHSDY